MRGYLVSGLWLLLGVTAAWAGDGGAATVSAPSTGSGPSTQPAGDAAGIQRLIGRLGSDKFAERDAAQQALVKIGLPAVEHLRAAAEDKNRERSERAKQAMEQIEDSLASAPMRIFTAFQEQDKQLAGRLLRDLPWLVNSKLPYGDRALHLALSLRWFDLAEELVKTGANVNATYGTSGRTALHGAAGGGNVEAIRFLAKHGADLTAVDDKGFTSLHDAVMEDPNAPAVAALIEAGADVNATGKVGVTPLTLAIIGNGCISRDDELAENAACIKLLLDHKARLDVLSAAGLGRMDALRSMIARKEPLEVELAPFKMRVSALYVAAMCGQADAARALIEAGADLKSATREAGTPLHAAARAGHGQIVKLLLDAGADPNAATDREGLPIHAAAERGHAGVVAQLLDAGCDVSAPGHSGRTPLIEAASAGRLAVVKLLLVRGADAVGKPNTGTPLQSVCNGVLIATEGWMEKGQDYPACAKLLLAAGADIEVPDRQGWRPLHWACRKPGTGRLSPQIVQVARVLIDAGADVNAAVTSPKTGYRRWTPICFAADSCSPDLIKALLDAGADPFVENVRGESMPVEISAGMVDVGGKAAHELLQAATDKREQAEQRRVEAVTTEFLQAVADANDAAARALTVEGLEYWSHDKWPARIKRIRDRSNLEPQMLGPILAAKVRPNWAEVRTGMSDQPAQPGQEPRPRCAVFILMHMPDGSWRLAEFAEVSYDPQGKLGVYLQDIDVGGGFRDKVFGATDEAKQKKPPAAPTTDPAT
jgi:ankyrin repeat protein